MTDTAKLDRYESALRRISEWGRAYPLERFPEPDLERAKQVLEANGISLGAISASAMRHVIDRVAQIADAALEPEK